MRKDVSKCPKCKTSMLWQEGLLDDGGGRDMSVGRYYCTDCGIIGLPMPSNAVREGGELADKMVDVGAMDREITKRSVGSQLGILRARQHCATCHQPTYSSDPKPEHECHCTKCKCLYCREYK